MSADHAVQSRLLSRLNERLVFSVLREKPMSRAELARHTRLTPPTISKAVAGLLEAGFVEEFDERPLEASRGRPARKVRLASQRVQVVGVVVDVQECAVVAAGLDGTYRAEPVVFNTPATYTELIDALCERIAALPQPTDSANLGIGLSMPGLIDYRRQVGLVSPNMHITDGHSPTGDLTARLGIDGLILQESHALCLAEQHFGGARGLGDFAVLDVSIGVGLGVMTGGRLLTGHSGLAGEIGHITVADPGRLCGCGNTGCLETLAGDLALAWHIGQRLGRDVAVTEALAMVRANPDDYRQELQDCVRYMGMGVAAVINLFNPSNLFIHGQVFDVAPLTFEQTIEAARRRAMGPSFADCCIRPAQGSKMQGAVAGIIQRVTSSIAPQLEHGFARFDS